MRAKNVITLTAHGSEFSVKVVGLDGRVAASMSTKTGKALTIRTGAMAPGIYFIKALVDGKSFTAPFLIQD